MAEPKLPEVAFAGAERLSEAGVLVELGHLRRKQVRRLRRGEGLLAAHIQAAVEQRRHELGIHAGAEIVPVVLLYRETDPDYVVLTPVRAADDR